MSFNIPLSIGSMEALLAHDSITARYKLYGGDIELLYDADAHSYMIEREGQRIIVPGVTSITGTMDKPALVPWAVKLAAEYIKAKMLAASYLKDEDPLQRRVSDMDWDLFEKWLNEAKADYRKVSQTALDIGHVAHDWLEKYSKALIAGQTPNMALPVIEVPKVSNLDPVLAQQYITQAQKNQAAAQNCVKAGLEWMEKHNFRPLRVENKVYSRLYNFAGTFDWVAMLDSCHDPKCCGVVRGGIRESLEFKDWRFLGDWKSSKGMYNEYRFQTAAYQQGQIEEYGEEYIQGRFVTKLGKDDGQFAAFLLPNEDFQKDFGVFVGLQTAYERVREVDAADKEEREFNRMLVKQAKEDAKVAAKAAKTTKKEVIVVQ